MKNKAWIGLPRRLVLALAATLTLSLVTNPYGGVHHVQALATAKAEDIPIGAIYR